MLTTALLYRFVDLDVPSDHHSLHEYCSKTIIASLKYSQQSVVLYAQIWQIIKVLYLQTHTNLYRLCVGYLFYILSFPYCPGACFCICTFGTCHSFQSGADLVTML